MDIQKSIKDKLERLIDRQQELHSLLSDPEVIKNQYRFRDLSRESAEIAPVIACFNAYRANLGDIEEAKELQQEEDEAMQMLASEELKEMEAKHIQLENELKEALLPFDPEDNSNIFLEIRAGTGGTEAALFVGDLVRMYSRYAELKGWKIEYINASESELDGYKEIILRMTGKAIYSKLKFESGVHRVQRVPETESQGRIHTSTCTIAVLPEGDKISEIEINPADLRIDTFRASGAGGQHVNKTDSAIRITHFPSGMIVECQDERSQHKNKARALSLLKARLLDREREKQRIERAQNRRDLVGSGDRSERIRTYNFPQNRVTDHRINLTFYRLDEILEGNLDLLFEPLLSEHQADLLAALMDEA